jgi:hypothetical protein
MGFFSFFFVEKLVLHVLIREILRLKLNFKISSLILRILVLIVEKGILYFGYLIAVKRNSVKSRAKLPTTHVFCLSWTVLLDSSLSYGVIITGLLICNVFPGPSRQKKTAKI